MNFFDDILSASLAAFRKHYSCETVLVWYHCSIESTRKMEKIQERGLRFVYNDSTSSYKELLSIANKKMLYIDRLKRIALFVFKCIHHQGPSTVHDLFSAKPNSYSFRDPIKAVQPKVDSTTFGLHSLRYSGAALWNNLPNELKGTVELNTFKRLLKSWNGPSCKCGFCILCTV